MTSILSRSPYAAGCEVCGAGAGADYDQMVRAGMPGFKDHRANLRALAGDYWFTAVASLQRNANVCDRCHAHLQDIHRRYERTRTWALAALHLAPDHPDLQQLREYFPARADDDGARSVDFIRSGAFAQIKEIGH